MTQHLDLDALQAAAEAATSGPWDYDTERNDGDYGDGPDCGSGFDSYAIHDEKGQTLFDSLNSDAACVQEECDEDHFRAWDEVAERNAKFIAAANPAVILALIDRLRKAEAGLLLALYHHQGGSSAVGQPIRRFLGIGQYDYLTDEQIERGKQFAASDSTPTDSAEKTKGGAA